MPSGLLSAASYLIVAHDRMLAVRIKAAVGDAARLTVVQDIAALLAQSASRRHDMVIGQSAVFGAGSPAICAELRLLNSVPLILLVDPDDVALRIACLNAGADDCIPDTAGPQELTARIASLLRRASYAISPPDRRDMICFDGWSIDTRHRLLINPGGGIVTITAAEFDLLVALCRNAGKVQSREQLLALMFAGVAKPVVRSIDVHINRLRNKIEKDPHHPQYLKTVRLGGYLMTAKVVFT